MMSDTAKPKRVIDRERQWRKLDAGRYASPKGRFIAARDDDGWLLADITGEIEPAWYARWRDARAAVEIVEFGDPGKPAPIELVEDEVVDEFHDFYRVVAKGDARLFEVVANRGGVHVQLYLPSYAIDEAEALATAIRLAALRAAAMNRKEA